MGGPKQKGVNAYGPSLSPPPLPSLLHQADWTLVRAAVVSPFRQAPMRGVVSHWVFNGYKRLMSQAPYFVIPLAAGKPCPCSVEGSGGGADLFSPATLSRIPHCSIVCCFVSALAPALVIATRRLRADRVGQGRQPLPQLQGGTHRRQVPVIGSCMSAGSCGMEDFGSC